MFDLQWRNKRASLACLLVLAACENPAIDRERDPTQGTPGGAARGTANRSPTTSDTEPNLNTTATAGAPGSANEIADAAVRRTPSTVATPCAASGAARQETCEGKLAGVYGIEMDLDVFWSDEINATAPAYDPGRGKITTLLIGELNGLCPGDAEGELVMRVCDLRLPPIYVDSIGGVVQLVLPHAAWEQPAIPELTARVRSTGLEHTGFEILTPVIAMLGIELASSDAAWPSYTETPFVTCLGGKKGRDCFPDQDADGNPGISLRAELDGLPPPAASRRQGGWHYTPAPTAAGLPYFGTGAATLFAGLQTTLGGAYPLGPNCDGETGPADAADVALRVYDCVMQDGAPCTPSAATIVDQNMPVFHLLSAGEAPASAWKNLRRDADAALDRSASVGPRNTVMRLGDQGAELSCEDVREVFAVR
jgi:hypothetical protein